MRFYLHLSLLIADELRYLQIDNGGAGLIFQIVSISYKRGASVSVGIACGPTSSAMRL
jgi:DNA replication protein DnaC